MKSTCSFQYFAGYNITLGKNTLYTYLCLLILTWQEDSICVWKICFCFSLFSGISKWGKYHIMEMRLINDAKSRIFFQGSSDIQGTEDCHQGEEAFLIFSLRLKVVQLYQEFQIFWRGKFSSDFYTHTISKAKQDWIIYGERHFSIDDLLHFF